MQDTQESKKAGAARYLPLAIDVEGLKCLVVGGGRVGARKAVTLAEAGALVTLLAPEVNDRLMSAIESGQVTWRQDAWPAEDAADYTFVIAATDDPSLNLRIAEDVHGHGGLACVVSPGRFSRVIFPAVHRADGVTVAVHSDGRDCGRSRRTRDAIAAALDRWKEPPRQTAVLGVARQDVPYEVFRSLERFGPGDEPDGAAGFATLATCRRWEAYFVSSHPRGMGRDLRAAIHTRTGVMLEAHRDAVYFRTGAAALHHLLRVASGLDSPLLGETEVVGQIRSAIPESAPAGDDVRETFEAAVRAQKTIRKESGLVPAGSWVALVARRLTGTLGGLQQRRVAVVGCGRLGEQIARRLMEEGARVVPVSRRAGGAGVPWCDQLGLPVVSPQQFSDQSERAHAVILTAELAAAPLERLCSELRNGSTVVVDLAEAHREDLSGVSPAGYNGLRQIGQTPLTGRQAAASAQAERLAVAHSLRLFSRRHPQPVPPPIRLGGRGSRLSLRQIEEVNGYLARLVPGAEVRNVTMDTPCDRDRQTPLPQVRDDDFFTRDLDEALLRGDIDVALHSAKDLPAVLRKGLVVAALTPSLAPWEALLTRDGASLHEIPPAARVGTSSDRRREGILRLRPDLEPADIRGNVPDRLRQLERGDYDALVLAAVGLLRLGEEDRISQVFSLEEFPATPGQGALALVVREDNRTLRRLLEPLDLGDREAMPW